MTDPPLQQSEVKVWRPCGRAFFVYYVAIAVAWFGPLINPAVGMPAWLGIILGGLVAFGVAYHKFGQEYRLTAQGVSKIWRWPWHEQRLGWDKVGKVEVRRGLTQTLLRVGNVVIHDQTGGEEVFWYGLSNPKEVQAAVEAQRPAAPGAADQA